MLATNEVLEIQYRNDRASWDAFVTSINDALNPLDLEFAHLYDEISGQEIYAVVRPDSELFHICDVGLISV